MSAETRANLDAAIRAHSAEEWGGDLVVDWVLVAGLVGADIENSIGVEASRESMPGYITNGLLYEAMNLSEYQQPGDDDD